MKKLLILFRLYDKTYGENGNPETLAVNLCEDNTLSYSLYMGWQDSGMGCAISNLQLKEILPSSPKSFSRTSALRLRIANILATGVGSHYIKSSEILNELKVKVTAPKKQSVTKMWIGCIPEIYGYGVMVMECTEDEARKSLKRAFANAKRSNQGERSYNDSFIHWGGRIFEVQTGKHYGDDFCE